MNVLNSFKITLDHEINYSYWLSLPEDYAVSDRKYPLILFLHGAGERGTDPEKVKVWGVPAMIERGEKIDAIVVSPQCPDGMIWDTQVYALKALLDYIIQTYRVDTGKVCCTGLSMGGFGTWMMGITFPDFFYKLAPVCGGGIAWQAGQLKNIPIRAYHGAVDTVVNPDRSREMVDAVNRAGGHAELIVYEGVGHDSWRNAYDRDGLVDWLLAD